MDAKNAGILVILAFFTVFAISYLAGAVKPLPPIGGVPGESLGFETIEQGYYSGHAEKGNYVITDAAGWKDLWTKVHPSLFQQYQTSDKPLPDVDFENEAVIAVFQGERPTGGYKIQILRVAFNALDGLEVLVKETSPPPGGCAVTEALTEPFHIIKVKKAGKVPIPDKNVKFIIEREVTVC